VAIHSTIVIGDGEKVVVMDIIWTPLNILIMGILMKTIKYFIAYSPTFID
jgi:hypothetical protein